MTTILSFESSRASTKECHQSHNRTPSPGERHPVGAESGVVIHHHCRGVQPLRCPERRVDRLGKNLAWKATSRLLATSIASSSFVKP